MTNINLLCVAAPGCHPQGVFQNKGIQAQNVNIGKHHPLEFNQPSSWDAHLRSILARWMCSLFL